MRLKTFKINRKLVCSLLTLLCMTATMTAAVTLDEARGYINHENYERAVPAFRTLMRTKSYATRADCNKWMGQALCMTGAYAEAVPYLEFAAKRKVTGAFWYLGLCRQKGYDFEGAIAAFTEYKKLMKNSSAWVQRSDSLIAECQIGLSAVSHVQDVVIIDSLYVPRQAFFAHYKLGSESGRLLGAEACRASFDGLTVASPVFESQAGDYRMAVTDDAGGRHLVETHLFNNEWGEAHPIASVEAGGSRLAFPFLRSDGETLYFASDRGPGLGGLDLYKTHYNSETDAYYTPERLGMPFNSPYDDYMMAIDETNQVGWWATDRVGNPDFVTIYLFLLPEEPAYLEGNQTARARIDRIADSWREAGGYAELVERIMAAPQRQEVQPQVLIVIDDKHIYTSEDQFLNRYARSAYDKALRTQKELDALTADLDGLRREWHTAGSTRRTQLKPQILRQEQKEVTLRSQLADLQKQYRNLEINKY